MKKLLLLTTFAISGAVASAQCTPDPLYADSVFGVWPDTTENFMPGVVGLLYSDTLNLIVPANASEIPADPPYPPLALDSIQLLSVDGLPPGITVSCNSQTAASCTYLPTQLGCGLIQGTPTTTGTFPIELSVRAWSTINIVVPFPVSQDITFGGYEIVISDNTTAVLSLTNTGLSNVRNIPNPFASRTMIEFNAGKAGEARIRVFNLVGEEMWNEVVETKVGQNRVPFDGAQFPAGVYLYKIESGSNTFTGRMALQR
ncbi:MAG TPA: T9SS type A sorting domain-containing protein [Flavobacteriales bacterium]|nr:T9SS type A sorting domain-containing protein [Flavobacteriales bacterium]